MGFSRTDRPVARAATGGVGPLILAGLLCWPGACGGGPEEAGRSAPGGPGATPALPPRELLPCRAIPTDLGERALAHARRIVAFGPRNPGSDANRQAIAWCAERLAGLGFTVTVDTWEEEGEGGVELRNLSAVLPGQVPDRILLACHHDTKITSGHPVARHNFPFDGANDGASGQAVLLELAALLAADENRRATYEIVMFDGEESFPFDWDPDRALYGSRRYAARYRDRMLTPDQPTQIRAMVLLDMVGGAAMDIDDETSSTLALRRLLKLAVDSCGHGARFFGQRGAVIDDHRPFLEIGVPALNLVDLYGNPTWHTPEDNMANLSPTSMQAVAQVVWTMLPAVERGYVPEPAGSLRIPR